MPRTFSASLPADCPLPRAVDCNREVYFLVDQLPLNASQFLSQAERGRATGVSGEKVCTRHGLSVFPDKASCAHQVELFPRLGPHITCATLAEEHGKIADTPSGNNPAHMTWWPYADVERHGLFAVVAG